MIARGSIAFLGGHVMARYALLVGINAYANSRFDLRGCVNDVESLSRLLTSSYGFAGTDIRTLTDGAANRAAILEGLGKLLDAAAPGDTIVFGFSGHGTQMPAQDADEQDFKDECLVPHESNLTSLISDNELRVIFEARLKAGVNATAIYDCCHSGTMYRTLSIDLDTGLFIEPVVNRYLQFTDLSQHLLRAFNVAGYNILSACRDEETAADVLAAGPQKISHGAFSYALHEALRQNPAAPLIVAEPQIADGIGRLSKHKQTPNYYLVDAGGPLIRF